VQREGGEVGVLGGRFIRGEWDLLGGGGWFLGRGAGGFGCWGFCCGLGGGGLCVLGVVGGVVGWGGGPISEIFPV